MASLTDVAREAGVSKATASRALSEAANVAPATRDRVQDAASRLGYVVSASAASLVTGRSHTVGVITPMINRWFFAEVIEGIQAELEERGYDLTLFVARDGERRERLFDYFLLRKRVDAVITVGIALSDEETEQLRALDRPHVAVGPALSGVTSITIDDRAVGRLATEHLLSLGHRRIVHLGGGDDEQQAFHAHQGRLRGFREAMADAGADDHDDDSRVTPYTTPGGYAAALELLADPRSRPTAIVAGCDDIAIGVIAAARQLGIQVPAQLSVVGIDDHSLAETYGLTTVRQDPRAQGARAAELVLADDAGDLLAEPRILEVEATLRVRSSTMAPATLAVAG